MKYIILLLAALAVTSAVVGQAQDGRNHNNQSACESFAILLYARSHNCNNDRYIYNYNNYIVYTISGQVNP